MASFLSQALANARMVEQTVPAEMTSYGNVTAMLELGTKEGLDYLWWDSLQVGTLSSRACPCLPLDDVFAHACGRRSPIPAVRLAKSSSWALIRRLISRAGSRMLRVFRAWLCNDWERLVTIPKYFMLPRRINKCSPCRYLMAALVHSCAMIATVRRSRTTYAVC